MAKNQNNITKDSQSQGSFRRIFKAMKRRISPTRPLITHSPSSTNSADVKPSASNKAVTIEYNHNPVITNVKPMSKPQVNNNMGAKDQQNQGSKGVKFQGYSNNTAPTSNEKFGDFIENVKKKIKATSTFVVDDNTTTAATGAKRTTTRRDSFNDRVSHFINRAKLKMRTTTMVSDGGGGDHVYADGKLKPYVPR